jgi:23S rRNA (uridine2552-2'-O)-methyltransferase
MARSSKQWLRRHVTDPYVRKAQEQGYRSRAAFKLLEINQREKLLRRGGVVVDLGAAPGGWSQVAAASVMPGGRVIAIDLLKIAPISGVTVLQADFRDQILTETLGETKADVVLSDLAPNLSGIANVDQARALELALAAIEFSRQTLKPEGALLVKAFHGEAFGEVVTRLKAVFGNVKTVKPPASRGESAVTYLVARALLCSAKTA